MKVISAEFMASVGELAQCPAGRKPEVALAGRSNVGKSSLLNTLANRPGLAKVSNTPGRTQTINFFLINKDFFLVDLPGYGYARVPEVVRNRWGSLVEGYLKRREQLKGVIQIVDIRHPPSTQDLQLYEFLNYYRFPVAIVATKADKLSRSQGIKQLGMIKQVFGLAQEHVIMFSAKTGQGKDELWRIINGWLGKRT